MTKKDIEQHIRANENGADRSDRLIELLHTMWAGGMTSDQPITTVATIGHVVASNTPSQNRHLLNRLISMGFVEEFDLVRQKRSQRITCGRNETSQRRYRLTEAAVSVYEQ